jgi:alpha-1,6-mannosyltransferase
VTALSGLGFGWTGGLAHTGDSVQWTAPATAIGLTIGYLGRLGGAHVDAVPAVRAVGLGVLAVTLAGIWWRTRPWRAGGDGRTVLAGAGWALLATVALGPVFQPWYLIWPLMVLAAAGRGTRALALACAVACFLVLPDGTALALFSRFPGSIAMTLLVIGFAGYGMARRGVLRRVVRYRGGVRGAGSGSDWRAGTRRG